MTLATIQCVVHHFGGSLDPAWGSGAPGVGVVLSQGARLLAQNITDAAGWCKFSGLAAGTYGLSYNPPLGMVLAKGQAATLSVTLSAGANVWPPQVAVVSAVPIGFYAGYVVTSEIGGWVSEITAAVDRTPVLINQYIDYTQTKSLWQYGALQQAERLSASNLGLIPAVAIPLGSSADRDVAQSAFAKITGGAWDVYYAAIFQAYQGFPNGWLRIGWEQNLADYPWAVTTLSLASAFAAAFVHIATIARAALPGWRIIWNPSQVYQGAVTTQSTYPGDASVDVIGHDVFSTMFPYGGSDWKGAVPAVTATGWDVPTAVAFARSRGKPFALCEVGAGGPGNVTPTDDPSFVEAMVKEIAPARLEYVSLWNYGTYMFTQGLRPFEAAAWKDALAIQI